MSRLSLKAVLFCYKQAWTCPEHAHPSDSYSYNLNYVTSETLISNKLNIQIEYIRVWRKLRCNHFILATVLVEELKPGLQCQMVWCIQPSTHDNMTPHPAVF